MSYYKIIRNGYVDGVGTGDGLEVSISANEYESILEIISNKPEDTATHYYMLDAETLQYVAVERDTPVEEPITEEQAFINRLISEVNN